MPDHGGFNLVGGDQFNQFGDRPIGVLNVSLQPTPPEPHRRPILLLMSNPLDTGPLRLDEEYREIKLAISGARHRDRLELFLGAAPRYHDLHALLADHQPAVVHYAGHSGGGGIALTDDNGDTHRIAPHALEDLFEIMGDSVSCVVLNACLSEDQALAIAAHVPCVVGMSNSVPDHIAIEFAAGFYRAIADGRSVAQAFQLGRNRLALSGADNRAPVIVAKPGVAERLVITG